MNMKIAKYDNILINPMTEEEKTAYLRDEINYSVVPYKEKLKPMNGWAMPYITGHKYRVHWQEGLDFTSMSVQLSENWETTDDQIVFNMNFTDVREAVNFTTSGTQVMNDTIISGDNFLGYNLVRNDTETRDITFVVNYHDESAGRNLLITGHKCFSGVCDNGVVEEVEMEAGSRLWSDPLNWPGEVLPAEGDDVIIESGWNMYLDIEETPIFKSLEINGRLTFLNSNFSITLNSHRIWVRAGELLIGTEDDPFKETATIVLHGNQDDETFALTPTLEVYNKVLANIGRMAMYG
jgi:hypothetical protein